MNRRDEVARLFHSTQGSIRTLGAQRYVAAAREIETAIRRGEGERVVGLWEQVERELAATLASGRRWVATQGWDAMPDSADETNQFSEPCCCTAHLRDRR